MGPVPDTAFVAEVVEVLALLKTTTISLHGQVVGEDVEAQFGGEAEEMVGI
jgi:hypothetical protein